MEETPKGGRGRPWAVAPLERERICKLIINKHRNVCVGCLLEWCWCSCLKLARVIDMECILEREAEILMIQGVIISCLAFCYLSISSWCGTMTACILCIYFRNPSVKWLISKKWLTTSSTIWRPFFRALIFSSCLSTMASESSFIFWFTESCHLFKLVFSQLSSMRIKTSWIWASSAAGDPSAGTLQRTFLTSPCLRGIPGNH